MFSKKIKLKIIPPDISIKIIAVERRKKGGKVTYNLY
jgi:hypothetical protein